MILALSAHQIGTIRLDRLQSPCLPLEMQPALTRQSRSRPYREMQMTLSLTEFFPLPH